MTPKKIQGYFQKDFFENQAWSQYRTIAGIDEVGRGCVAGPLVVACVILPAQTPSFLKDSKCMSSQDREIAYTWIIGHCYSTYSILHQRIIDKYNIYNTTLLGMRKVALQAFVEYPHIIHTFLVDAMPLTMTGSLSHNPTIYYFNKAENYSSSVAAASIVAKVVRDRLMERLNISFVDYGLSSHKGYPTPLHRKQVIEKQSNFLYRKTFLTSWPYIKK